MAAAEDEDSVETISAESADPAFGVSVHVGRLDGRADHRDALSPEDLVEGVAELGVAVVTRNRNGCSSPSRMIRLRACWATQLPSGSRCRRRTRSTVRKSQASTLDACARKNGRHDECVRCGAGGRPASSSTLRTEVAETRMPRPLSSPTIRLYPQCGFSSARRGISLRTERSSGGRPGVACEYVHRRPMSSPCQRSSVSGLIGKIARPAAKANGSATPATRDQPESASALRSAGGGSPARAGGRGSPSPSSHAVVPAAIPARTGSEQRDTRTTRANGPPSTTARDTKLASPTLGRAADEFANPTRSTAPPEMALSRDFPASACPHRSSRTGTGREPVPKPGGLQPCEAGCRAIASGAVIAFPTSHAA
jgi:hypothetical protein